MVGVEKRLLVTYWHTPYQKELRTERELVLRTRKLARE